MFSTNLSGLEKASMIQEPFVDLPQTKRLWKDTKPFWKHWEDLRAFFASHGFTLYQRDLKRDDNLVLHPEESVSPPERPFGLFGDMTGCSSRYVASNNITYPARDESGRDVIIKAIHNFEGKSELEIIHFLNSEPRRSDQGNPTIPVLLFLQYGDWNFVITPMWGVCYDSNSLNNVAECLEFGKQLLHGISYLHRWGIAHQDIAFENIMINGRGKEPLDFRSSHDGRDITSIMVKPFENGREQRSPEVASGDPCNPFASDIYMTGRFLYAWFSTILRDVPGLLELLQDMTELNPALRPSASDATNRFCDLHPAADIDSTLSVEDGIDIDIEYPPVPGRQFTIKLPESMQKWSNLLLSEYLACWEALRPFFAEHGFILFDPDESRALLSFTRGRPSPGQAHSPKGDRSELVTRFPTTFRKIYAARHSRSQQDFLIKLVNYNDEGVGEMEILRRFRDDEVLGRFGLPSALFLTYEKYCFGVWYIWQDCATPPPVTIEECFAVIQQAIEKLHLLHEDRIVHLDLHPTKFRMPVYGKVAPDFRTSLDVDYLYTGFGKAHRFPEDLEPQSRVLPPRRSLRPNRAPEMDGKSMFNPFAADVYMLAQMLYALFKPIVPDAPGLLSLLQDMSRFEPTERISLASALERFHDVQQNVSKEQLVAQRFDIVYDETFPSIPSDIEHLSVSSSDVESSEAPIPNASDTMSRSGDTSLARSGRNAKTSLQGGDEEISDVKVCSLAEAQFDGQTCTNGIPKSIEADSDTAFAAECLKSDVLRPPVVPSNAV